MADDPYSILEVEQGATDSEVKAAYRRLAAKYHPDRNPGFQDAANEKLKALNDAYARIKASGGARPADTSAPPTASQPETAQERRRPADNQTSEGLDHETAIAMELARVGVLRDADRDNPIVEVVASTVVSGSRISVCAPYSAVAASGHYGFREIHRSFMRIAPANGASAALPFISGLGPMARTEFVLCVADAMLWTTWRIAPEDFAWEQVTVTAYSLAFADILGSQVTSARKGTVDVWIDDGPTLTFRTAPDDAEALSTYIDAAALSQ